MGNSRVFLAIMLASSLTLSTLMILHRPVDMFARELDELPPLSQADKLLSASNDGSKKKSLQYSTSGASHNPFQLLALTPNPGFVVGIVSPVYRKIPMFLYLDIKDNFMLVHENQTFSKSYTSAKSHAEILYCWFDVGVQQWVKWKDNPPPAATIKDPLQLGEEYNVRLLVDPALQQGISHTLSATTIVRKTMRFYNGKNQVPNSVFDAQVKPKWDDDETIRRLQFWMKHYQSIGVDHFYIIDNEVDVNKPNLQEIENMPNVTYIRLPNVQFDGYRLEDNLKGLRYGFPGQVVMENAVLRMVNTEWLVYTDLDELIVPAMHNHSLSDLIDFFKDKNCHYAGGNVVKCRPLDSKMAGIFELKFFNVLINKQDEVYKVQHPAGKVMVRPNATEAMLIHYGRAFQSGEYGRVDVPTKHGYMAHYHALENLTEELLSGAHQHAKEMTIDLHV